MSLSGKNAIDWPAFQRALGEIPTIDAPPLVKQKSRDFFWYSPVLNRQLSGHTGDLVAQPRNRDELARCLQTAYQWRAPVVIRGGGTGNYGQAVPVEGGLIVDVTALDQVLEIGPGWVRVEAGCKIRKLNDALHATGQELPTFPSTQDMATIGGYIAGGSGGIGSLEHGMLRDRGNIISLTVLSVEAEPQLHTFTGEAINLVHHAWGINGVIVELTLRAAPAREWINCLASFPTYRDAYAAGIALTAQPEAQLKMVSTVEARIAEHFRSLRGRIDNGRALLISLAARADVPRVAAAAEAAGGRLELALDEAGLRAAGLPHVFEFSYNHTTLQVLKTDKSVTYLQVLFPAPLEVAKVDELQRALGEDVWMHHEFSRLNHQLVAFDLPIVRYTTDERLYAIMACYNAHGCPVSDPHTYLIEGGGMKSADYRHLALKKRLDPLGLLNSGKSREWSKVKHLSPEAIEALQGAAPLDP